MKALFEPQLQGFSWNWHKNSELSKTAWYPGQFLGNTPGTRSVTIWLNYLVKNSHKNIQSNNHQTRECQ